MKLAFRILWTPLSIALEAFGCLIVLSFLPILVLFGIIGLFSGGFDDPFGDSCGGSFIVGRNTAALKAKIASACLWFAAFGILFFFDQKVARAVFNVHLNFVEANSGAAVGAVIFRRYMAKRRSTKMKASTQGKGTVGWAANPFPPQVVPQHPTPKKPV